MRIIEYEPTRFEQLRETVLRMGAAESLAHRPYVDWYYTGQAWCRLYLALADDDTLAGLIGLERMPFAAGARQVVIGFATNYYAFQHGVGGLLFLQWMKSCPYGVVFGGTPDTHKIIASQKWTYFNGMNRYILNRRYPAHPGEALWRRAAKAALRAVQPRVSPAECERRLPAAARGLEVREVPAVTPELLPTASPFGCRFAPPVEYLNWRYNTKLPFVRYRVFALREQGAACGYVIYNEQPQRLLVAQCDGADAGKLACGIVLGAAALLKESPGPREVDLVSSHPEMQRIFTPVGFRAPGGDRPFAVGRLGRPLDLPKDAADWLINFDWGDNGVRGPFGEQRV